MALVERKATSGTGMQEIRNDDIVLHFFRMPLYRQDRKRFVYDRFDRLIAMNGDRPQIFS